MAVNNSRSNNSSLEEGSTDGKYRKVRPNTEVAKGTGDDITLANRRGLHPYWNYDFIDQEAPTMVAPTDITASSKPRTPTPVAHIMNDQMGANY
jgi:hypothetical protein